MKCKRCDNYREDTLDDFIRRIATCTAEATFNAYDSTK